MKKVASTGLAAIALLSSGIATAELSGNAAISSNYVWRGFTQTNDQAAGSGGIDWSSDSGLYAGTWVSNVAFGSPTGGGYEMDVYAGYGGEAGSMSYDVGFISYQYPVAPNTHFEEIYASVSFNIVTVGLASTVSAGSANDGGPFDAGDLYLHAGVDLNSGLSVYLGQYSFDADGTAGDFDYVHYGVSYGAGDFTFALDKNDVDDTHAFGAGDESADNVRATVTWSTEFEL